MVVVFSCGRADTLLVFGIVPMFPSYTGHPVTGSLTTSCVPGFESDFFSSFDAAVSGTSRPVRGAHAVLHMP